MTSFTRILRNTVTFKAKEVEVAEKVGMIALGMSLVIIALIITFSVLSTKQKRQQEIIDDGFALTDLVANYSAKGLEKTEENNILMIVDGIGRKSGLLYGMIIDTDGRVITHTNSNLVDHILNDPISLRAATSSNPLKQVYRDPDTDSRIQEFSRPLYSGGKKAGAVRLGFSQDAFPLFSDTDIRGLLLIATLIFALVPMFYYLVRRSPRLLNSFDEELNKLLAKNDFETIEVSSGEATGTVADRFSQVISRYKDTYQKLSVSCEDMEVANGVLSYERERIESVIDSMDEGIMVRDLTGRILHANPAMAYLMNLSIHNVIGKTLRESIENEEIISFIERIQLNGSSLTQKNLKIILKQFGGEKTVLISYLPLISTREDVLGSVIIAKDITAAKMAQQNQSDFITHVAHELRTPLTTIKSYVEMLMDDEISDGNTKIDFYNTINDEANRLSRLISNLLNISKIETGNMMITKDMIKTRAFLDDIVQSIKPQAISKNVNLTSMLPDKVSALVIEKDLLRISILNILGNAIKYTPEGGSITFKVSEDDSHVTIDIYDTGYGISEEELPHIFDKFFRSSDEKIKSHTGNGLGLALSREIMKLHGGKIEVSSAIGQGTHFTLTLPKEDSPRIRGYNNKLSSLMDT
jgi:PAS domain S-box-containing protein